MSLKEDYATMRIKRKTTDTTMAVRLDTANYDSVLTECIRRKVSVSTLLRELVELGLAEYFKNEPRKD